MLVAHLSVSGRCCLAHSLFSCRASPSMADGKFHCSVTEAHVCKQLNCSEWVMAGRRSCASWSRIQCPVQPSHHIAWQCSPENWPSRLFLWNNFTLNLRVKLTNVIVAETADWSGAGAACFCQTGRAVHESETENCRRPKLTVSCSSVFPVSPTTECLLFNIMPMLLLLSCVFTIISVLCFHHLTLSAVPSIRSFILLVRYRYHDIAWTAWKNFAKTDRQYSLIRFWRWKVKVTPWFKYVVANASMSTLECQSPYSWCSDGFLFLG